MGDRMGFVMDIKEAVQFFDGHISEHMIRQLVKKGEMPHFKQGYKKLLFDSDELERWWKNRLSQSVQSKKKDNTGYGTLRKINI